ncbi:SusC/RagA family TonB-linked outer membrane protein [Alistipes sp. An66]|uniref:SusC/RagA family TonB-linked outer membrane protein n=1 Tax=Alistipes sp. An66 TaxID=1965650 RepID=UPI000B395E71|nr:SusC/RagA family TonB-linked outer membrane protein [Alistipes sp. An66]OUN55965.1 SusC/RagA family TonB-linked outer membrane protein [Alistipes sp. An66]
MKLKLLQLLRTVLLLIECFWLVDSAVGQEYTIRGFVFDKDGKTPLAGVTVIIKNATVRGTVTGTNGQYQIQAKEGEELVFTFLGYESAIRKIGGGKSQIDVTLTPKSEQIESVVVTALGMTRKQKALGYAVSKVDNEDLTAAVSNNWLDALSGKVAGLNFDHASSGPGGSIRVTLRGESTVNMDNNTALFVIDGVPMSSGMTAMGGAAYNNTDASVDYGNGAADLNPEDIESVSVLKGPAATALYGSRAANGAIVITTKAGRDTKGIGVTFSSNFSFERAGYWPDFQNEYGPGNNGAQTYSFYTVKADDSTTGEAATRTYSRYTWGPRYEGQKFYQWASYDPATNMYTPLDFVPRDWYKGFFDTGATYKNSVAISGNNGKGGSIRVSFTDTRNSWIVPNTGYKSQSFALALNQKLRFVELTGKVNYYRKDSDNLPMIGYSTSSPTYTLLWSRNNLDIHWYEQEYRQGKDLYPQALNNLADNPYAQAYEQLNTMDRDRVYGNVSATFGLYEGLKLMLRSGLDMNREFRTRRKPFGTLSNLNGYYRQQNVENTELNNDFLLTYDRGFGQLHVNASLGGNSMYQETRVMTATADELLTEGVYNLSNAKSGVITKSQHSRKMVNSLYGLIQLSYADCLFLDITGRNDWSSALAPGHWSYFYPSISASWILTDTKVLGIRDHMPWITFLKIRASWANVGNDTQPFVINNYYASTDFSSGYFLPTTWALYNMKPENVESWEFGLEAKFLQNRITFDAAFYNNTTTDQIIDTPVDYSTGVNSKYINAGKIRNRGVELSSRLQPIRIRDFNWDVNLTWSKNWNKVISLAPGVDSWVISSGARGQVIATPGGTLGDLYGYGYEKAPEGSYILNIDGSKIDVSGQTIVDEHGYPVLSTDNLVKMGNVQPDWRAGLSTSLKYKGIRLSATFAAQWGGMAYSLTHAQLSRQGKLTNTLYGRYGGVLHEGVNIRGLDAQGHMVCTPNTTITENVVTYYLDRVYSLNNVETSTFDTSYLKLREVRIEWMLPKKWITRSRVLQGASVAIFGTNLFCWTNWPFYDPEVGTLNGASITRGFETASYPMTRTYGFNLKLSF